MTLADLDDPIVLVCTTTRRARIKRRIIVWALIAATIAAAAIFTPTPWYARWFGRIDPSAQEYRTETHLSAMTCDEWPRMTEDAQGKLAALVIITARHALGRQLPHDFSAPNAAEVDVLRAGLTTACATAAPDEPAALHAIDVYTTLGR